MKNKILFPFVLMLAFLLLFGGCFRDDKVFLASDYGVLPENIALENTRNLQKLIDALSVDGGTIYIPAGCYAFCAGGSQTIGEHCIRLRSNVSIVGDGEKTVLTPQGESAYGLDMFYFNDYLDLGEPNYLENCRFEKFVIDASGTSCRNYTSAGKGFMINLMRNCHWVDVTVMGTDATGFGMDCPVDCSVTDCTAAECGKAASVDNGGASGFGIGFGFSNMESIAISNCVAVDNCRFGFFFEHQNRFDQERYSATAPKGFAVTNAKASGNTWNFGGMRALNTVYRNCISKNALEYGYYFADCAECTVDKSTSSQEGVAAFSVITTTERTDLFNGSVTVSHCTVTDPGCCTVLARGYLHKLNLFGNITNQMEIRLQAQIENFTNENNSWNCEG